MWLQTGPFDFYIGSGWLGDSHINNAALDPCEVEEKLKALREQLERDKKPGCTYDMHVQLDR